MSSTRPVVVFCQGSFTTPGIYDDLRDAVQGRGCDIKVLPLATWWRGPEDNREPPSMYDDAAVIRTEVEQLAGQGKDVVVVSHSYAGTPVSEGTAQMGKASMISRGKKGGVVGIGYITSVVGQVGQSAGEILASKEGETAVPFETTPEGWFKLADVNQTARNVFSDLPFEEGLAWIKRFTQHSARSFADPLTKAGYLDPDVRLSYLLCERDVVVPPKVQRAGIEAMEQASGKKVLVTTIEADHSPMMGHLDRVADWIVAVTEPAN